LFVGTRIPATLKVLDSGSGRIIADLSIDSDPDDIFYDSQDQQVFVSCGAGFIDVFYQLDADHYRQLARIPTATGARTSLWVPELRRLFVAVPAMGNQKAEIRIFAME
jgi:hypothetical protein